MKRPHGHVQAGALAAVALLLGLLALLVWWGVRHQAARRFSKLWEVYSYSTNVAATAYESKRGGATVIWISGADDLMDPYGQVWNVYSFTNSVTASVYDSSRAGATIIWLSGADDVPRAATNAPAHGPRHPKSPPRKSKK